MKSLRCGPNHFTIVDDDYDPPEGWGLCFSLGYAHLTKKIKGKCMRIGMHRQILGLTDPKVYCDHANRNRLDNRRANLRVAGHQGNMRNRIFKGATFNKRTKKWRAQVTENYKCILLGIFHTEREAVACSNAYKIANWGGFANPYPLDRLS